MTTPQKVFAEHFHFWVLPLILALLKFLFDILPKPVFFVLFGLALASGYFYDKYRTKQEEIAAIELEKSADQFLDELNASEKARLEKESQKKALKEKLREHRLKNQAQQKMQRKSSSGDGNFKDKDEDDEEDDAALARIARNVKKN